LHSKAPVFLFPNDHVMITSKDNPQIKELKKLQEKRFRARRGQFAAEGEDLVDAALAAGWTPERIFHTPDATGELRDHPAAWEVDYDVLAGASALGSGARAIAVFELPAVAEPAFGELTLFVEGIADPGNVGTLIRSAAAFTDVPVLLGPGCADPWSPKALRAGMGTTFGAPPAAVDELPETAATVVVLDGRGDIDLRDVVAEGPVVICAGAEREGLSAQTLGRADLVARIGMRPAGPESLNVAMAATIALHQLAGIEH
jgi:TrmH family RNA methyltransferase